MTKTDLNFAEFEIGKEPEKVQLRRLDVLHHSGHELGLLISKGDYELVQILLPGDRIKDMAVYAEWAMIKTDATVKHIRKINQGIHEDKYILGMESMELLKL